MKSNSRTVPRFCVLVKRWGGIATVLAYAVHMQNTAGEIAIEYQPVDMQCLWKCSCRRDEQALSPLAFPALVKVFALAAQVQLEWVKLTAFKMKGLSTLTEIVLSKRFPAG